MNEAISSATRLGRHADLERRMRAWDAFQEARPNSPWAY